MQRKDENLSLNGLLNLLKGLINKPINNLESIDDNDKKENETHPFINLMNILTGLDVEEVKCNKAEKECPMTVNQCAKTSNLCEECADEEDCDCGRFEEDCDDFTLFCGENCGCPEGQCLEDIENSASNETNEDGTLKQPRFIKCFSVDENGNPKTFRRILIKITDSGRAVTWAGADNFEDAKKATLVSSWSPEHWTEFDEENEDDVDDIDYKREIINYFVANDLLLSHHTIYDIIYKTFDQPNSDIKLTYSGGKGLVDSFELRVSNFVNQWNTDEFTAKFNVDLHKPLSEQEEDFYIVMYNIINFDKIFG